VTSDDLRTLIDESAQRASVPAGTLVEALFERIAEYDPQLNAFYTLTPNLAYADAERVDEARRRGRPLPLDGLPIVVKDNIDVAGVRTSAASRSTDDTPAVKDAPCVARLRAVGAIVLGKAALHELAFGATTVNPPPFGVTRNPWNHERIPGGSSGGAGAAVAADLSIGALGSDTGGSIRIPAALNGVSGLRPTYGTISHSGVLHVAWSLDTVGPLARSADDIARMREHLVGYDVHDPWAVEYPSAGARRDEDVPGLRIGIPEAFFFEGLDPEIEAPVREAAETFASLGARLVPLGLPADDALCRAAAIIIRCEALALHRRRYNDRPELFGEEIRRRFQLGEELTGEALADAHRRRFEWQQALKQAFVDRVDLVLVPTTNTVAPLIEGSESIETSWLLTYLTYPWSLAHVPVLSLPCGFAGDGLPVGLQLVADHLAERLLLRAGAAYQRVTAWHRRRPPILVPAGV
jgi:aspartyl-tRNA(Asn)/glutamyl-tRNA(Gln) amidotransferase subunit A